MAYVAAHSACVAFAVCAAEAALLVNCGLRPIGHDAHRMGSNVAYTIMQEAEPCGQRAPRVSLPHPAPLSMGISLWGVLKSAIGKDLSKLTLPATINEPLSALQVLSEDMAQCYYPVKASKARSPAARMLWMAMFAFTPVNSSILRYRKPFNPLLGETFEWLSTDGDHRILVEQV